MNRAVLPVIVLATSKAWQAAIEREFPASMLIWALDENDLLAEADNYLDSAVVVEFVATGEGAAMNWLRLVLEQRRQVFVLASIQHSALAERLRALGVADVVVAISDTTRLHAMISRHNDRAPEHKLTLEQQIESALPWRS